MRPPAGALFAGALGVVALGAVAAAPLQAQTAKSQMTVGVQAPTPASGAHRPRAWGYPYYPYNPYPPPAPRKKRCEQDRLLTDTTPCEQAVGSDLGEPKP